MRIGSQAFIHGPMGPQPGAAPTRTGAAFSLPAQHVARPAMAGIAAQSSLPLLLPVGDALERRRQGVRRGRALLAGLDRLQIATLEGQGTAAALEALAQECGRIDAGDDPALAEVLEAIELRAAVELAKAGR